MGRDRTLDIVKGIGIVLVVLGHTSNILHNWIYSFHMPLFFMLSGMFHKNEKNYKEFLDKKIKSLLVPYFTFGIVLLLFWFFIGRFFGESAIRKTPLINCLVGLLYSNEIEGISSMEFAPYIWFLTCLFVIENIFYFLVKIIKKKKYFIFVGIIFVIFSNILSMTLEIPFPWNIDRALKDLLFYGFGYFYLDFFREKINLKKDLIIGMIMFLLNIMMYFLLSNRGYLSKEIMYIGGGILGGIATIKIFRCLKRNKILEFLGINTLVIFAFHGRAGSIIKLILLLLNININEETFYLDIVVTSLKILLCIPLIFIFNKYFSFFIGKNRNNINYNNQKLYEE